MNNFFDIFCLTVYYSKGQPSLSWRQKIHISQTVPNRALSNWGPFFPLMKLIIDKHTRQPRKKPWVKKKKKERETTSYPLTLKLPLCLTHTNNYDGDINSQPLSNLQIYSYFQAPFINFAIWGLEANAVFSPLSWRHWFFLLLFFSPHELELIL